MLSEHQQKALLHLARLQHSHQDSESSWAGRQQDSSSCYAYYTRGVPANIQDKSTGAAFLLYNDDSKTVEIEGLTQLKVPKQRYAKLVRLSIFAYVFLRKLPDATAKTPTMVPNLPMHIISLAFHLRYLENFDPQLQGYILIHRRPCDHDCWPQACAFWRRTKRGAKKCGPWVLGRFLSWDPSYVGKQAWIRSGSVVVGDIRAASSSIWIWRLGALQHRHQSLLSRMPPKSLIFSAILEVRHLKKPTVRTRTFNQWKTYLHINDQKNFHH